jgi:hypothetical protein
LSGKNFKLLFHEWGHDLDDWKKFYEKCHGKSGTLALFSTNKGKRWASFTNCKWDGRNSGKVKGDGSGFIARCNENGEINILRTKEGADEILTGKPWIFSNAGGPCYNADEKKMNCTISEDHY